MTENDHMCRPYLFGAYVSGLIAESPDAEDAIGLVVPCEIPDCDQVFVRYWNQDEWAREAEREAR